MNGKFLCAAVAVMVTTGAFAAARNADPRRDWKVVYADADGLCGKALAVLTEAVTARTGRDGGTTTSHVLPLERVGGEPVAKKHRFLVGVKGSVPEAEAFVPAADVPKGGYAVRTCCRGGTNTVAIVGDTPAAVLYGVFDFADVLIHEVVLKATADRNRADRIFYRDAFFRLESLPEFAHRTAPETAVRSIFTWGHVIDDYRLFFREMARSRLNRVILWNEYPPVNARDVVAEAHAWGIEVYWGFAWGWGTDCTEANVNELGKLGDKVFAEWRRVWAPLPGDGIYFQSFTEFWGREELGGRLIAEAVTELVNDVSRRIRAERPGLPIVFGLHSGSVSKRLPLIERTDPSIEILWENCGGFPFWEGNEKPATAFVDKILDSKRPVGLAWKAQLRQDWSCWAHQSGPYLLGCAGADVTRRDVALAEELQGLYTEDWYESGREAHALLRHIRGGAHPPAELNSVTEYNPPFAFSTLAEAELFWSAAEDWENVARRVRFRARSRW